MCWSVAVHCNLGFYSLNLAFLEKEVNGFNNLLDRVSMNYKLLC